MADTLLNNPVIETEARLKPIWTVRPPAPPEQAAEIAKDLKLPFLLASVMWSRGLHGESLELLKPPLTLTNIPELSVAAEKLEDAISQKKRIVIHGDYDADGISGTAVLTLGLRALGGNVTPFIPNRLHDGYGIHPDRVPEHIEKSDLFITVDCGISNLDEVARIKAAGVDVIVTDHHHPGQELPDCLVVHPSLSPSAQKGLPELTGAGVAYHLLWALHDRLGLEAPLEYSDLASIGTIADVAPLMGENRALIQEGLVRLADSKWPGIRATLNRTLSKNPTAQDVAFVLAPRLNAAGRLGEADLGLELLTTASERRAKELAAYLDARNSDRRNIQDDMFKDALNRVDPDAPAIVIDSSDWHPGVMGIVASKLLERYYKPVFIIAQGKGSVRSTPDISAVEGLNHAAEHLNRFGGHSQAAGFSINEGNIQNFRQSIYDYVESFPPPQASILADAVIASSTISAELYKSIQSLEPYGQGHPAPVFALTDSLDMCKAVGKSKSHLQLRVAGVKGVAWQKGEMAAHLKNGSNINAAISLNENHWNGKTSLEFIAEDLRPAETLCYGVSENQSKVKIEKQMIRASTAFENETVLQTLPLNEEKPLELTQPLQKLIRENQTITFNLTDSELARLEHLAAQYPSVQDLRRAFVCLKRGERMPFDANKTALCKIILEELELTNERGQALANQKRDPYSSESLIKGLTECYRLETFISAYKHLDDASFAHAVVTLFE